MFDQAPSILKTTHITKREKNSKRENSLVLIDSLRRMFTDVTKKKLTE